MYMLIKICAADSLERARVNKEGAKYQKEDQQLEIRCARGREVVRQGEKDGCGREGSNSEGRKQGRGRKKRHRRAEETKDDICSRRNWASKEYHRETSRAEEAQSTAGPCRARRGRQ